MSKSPCIQVCVINPSSGWCYGCHRTLQEIAAWGAMGSDERAKLLEALEIRAKNAPPVAQQGQRPERDAP